MASALATLLPEVPRHFSKKTSAWLTCPSILQTQVSEFKSMCEESCWRQRLCRFRFTSERSTDFRFVICDFRLNRAHQCGITNQKSAIANSQLLEEHQWQTFLTI